MHKGKDLVVGIQVDTNEYKYIDDVANGKECNCICPACKEKLIARQGEVRKHHFAHMHGTLCEYGVQTAMMYLAKMIIEEKGVFYLPDLKWNEYTLSDQFEIVKEGKKRSFGLVQVENVEVVYFTNSKLPDIMIDTNHGRIMLEIYMTHRITEKVKENIREKKITTLEVNIHDLDEIISKEQLTAILYNKVEMDHRSHYIYCKPLDEKLTQNKKLYDQLVLKQTLVHSISNYVRIQRTFQYTSITLYNIQDYNYYKIEENRIYKSPYSYMNESTIIDSIDTREECWIVYSITNEGKTVFNPYFFQIYNQYNLDARRIYSLDQLQRRYPGEKLLVYHHTKGYFLKVEDSNYSFSPQKEGDYKKINKPAEYYKRCWILLSHNASIIQKEVINKKKVLKEVNVEVKGQPLQTIDHLWKQGKYYSINVYDMVHHQGLMIDSKNIQTIGKLAPRANEKVWIIRKYTIEEEES